MVTVKVGCKEEKFLVHEDVLRMTSSFFNTALKKEWDASRKEERTVNLSEEQPGILGIYLHWVYMKALPTFIVGSQNPGAENPEYKVLAHAYALGERLLDTSFKNAVLQALCDAIGNQPYYETTCLGATTIHIIYGGTTAGSPARRLLVDIWAYAACEQWATQLDVMPHDFVVILARALSTSRSRPEGMKIPWRECTERYNEA
jgi:hypothetical protein